MTQSRHALSARHIGFAAALVAGLSAASALGQGYYPPANSPLDNNPALLFIQTQLTTASPTATLEIVPGTGETLATDDELNSALGAAVAAELSANSFSGTVYDLVNEAVKYRKGKSPKFITAATSAAILVSDDTARELALEQVVGGAVAGLGPADSKVSAKVVSSMLKLVASATSDSAVADDADDVAGAAIAAAEDYADIIVKEAMKAVKKSPDAAALMNSIAAEGVSSVFDAGAAYLADEVAAAAAGNTAALTTPGNLVSAIFGAGSTVPGNAKDVASVAAGLMRGSGSGSGATVAGAINGLGGTYGSFSGYISQVGLGFDAASGSSDATVSAAATVAGINAGNKDFIAARVTGAAGWLQKSVPLFIAGVLDADASLGGTGSVQDIVTAAIQGYQKGASKIATNAIGGGAGGGAEANRLGQIAKGTAIGLDGNPLYNSLLRGAIGKAVKAATPNSAITQEMTGFAVDGAEESGNTTAIADIVFAAAKSSKLAADAVVGAFDHVAAADQWRAVLGAMAADKKNASTIRSGAQLLGTYNASNNAALLTGGNALTATQADKKTAFDNGLTGFGASASASETLAVITGVGLINPKVASALAATAIANPHGASADNIRAAAIGLLPKSAPGINLAVDTAVHVNTSVSDLFEFVSHLTQQNPKFAADIATGAVGVAPSYAHVTAHAVGFASPLKAAKAVPVLFGYTVGSTVVKTGNIDNSVAAAAAITAGVTCGILEAKSSKEASALKATIAAAVKAAIGLEGNGAEGAGQFRQSDGTASGFATVTQKGPAGVITGYISQEVDATVNQLPGGATGTIGTVLTAAVKKAKGYALEIAQAAAQAIRSISPNFTSDLGGALATAISNGGSAFGSGQIQNAISFGITEAAAGRVGAGAAGVLNYAHFNCTGSPVTSIFEL